MEYGKRVLGLARIVAITSPDNAASAKLLGKLGMRLAKKVTLGDDPKEVDLYANDARPGGSTHARGALAPHTVVRAKGAAQPAQFLMNIEIDDLSGSAIARLLQEHLQSMALHSPPESVHALDIDALRKPEITFWTAWEGGELLGCGALKELDPRHAEVKSMRTSSQHLRKGVARALLNHIVEEARRRAYTRLSLETGSMEAFEPARNLYSAFGFTYCRPFADYVDDPNSVFMTRDLAQ
jgi:putative acetyltransferase